MRPGESVEIVQPILSGMINDSRYNPGIQDFEHEVHYTDGNGIPQQRWFPQSQLKGTEQK
jgi:hypothetical protein